MPPPKKGHTTLSDLLADDVRDYFLREGASVPEPETTTPAPRTRRSRSGRQRQSKRAGANKSDDGPARSASAPSVGATDNNNAAALVSSSNDGGSSWRAAGRSKSDGSTSRTSSSNRMESLKEDHQHQQQQHQQQQQQQMANSNNNQEQQFRGQITADRNTQSPRNSQKSQHPMDGQQHRRHGSGSGSFLSKGSGSSLRSAASLRTKTVTAADAEFLRRYAEEKERTNVRMTAARPNWGLSNTIEEGVPSDAVPSISPGTGVMPGIISPGSNGGGSSVGAISRPYHSILQSPRPPTALGSHRPGLPSIDNDDWEEDDRLERRDIRKMQKKEARRVERHRRRTSTASGHSLGANGSVEGGVSSSPTSLASGRNGLVPMRNFREDANGNSNNNNNNMIPRGSLERNTSQGSAHNQGTISHNSNVGMTPGGDSSTLCYSTASSHVFTTPDMPFHNRADSMGTFVRRSNSNDGGDNINTMRSVSESGANNGIQGQGFYPQQMPIKDSNGGDPKKENGTRLNRHVRPLSYLSASSDSGKESGELSYEGAKRNNDGELLRNNSGSYNTHSKEDSSSSPSLFGLAAASSMRSRSLTPISPQSSSTGGTGQFQRMMIPPYHTPDLSRMSSTDGSDLNSALLGSAIIDSAPSADGSSRYRFGRISSNSNQTTLGSYQQRQLHRYQEDEDSSEGSFDSDDSSDSSSYSSDSYYGDSSSNSQASSERRRPTSGQYQQSYQQGWQPVNFQSQNANGNQGSFTYQDIERGGGGTTSSADERENLVVRNNGLNYSSIKTNTPYPTKKSAPRNKKTPRRYNIKTPSSRNRRNNQRRGTGGPGAPLRLDEAIDSLLKKCNRLLVMMELFISNMPSLVGSLSLAWVSIGVDWFKWYEETFDACHPTQYHNSACIFPEFPGCFACDTDRDGYKIFLSIHYLCTTIAFVLSSFLVGKFMIAFPVVRDELANPTTAAPLGLLFMAFEKVFAGNFGLAGKVVTYVASALHTAVACWFLFISVVYQTLPEPSWFSNTTGIGLAAAKMYLYWTPGGYVLAVFSLLCFVMFYCVSLYRIHINEKISAPVCWVQLSGPAVVLYGFTIFSQPGSDADDFAMLDEENKEHFYQIHRKFYMPIQHILFGFCMISMVSSLYLLKSKWKSFREKEFSPAHVSFCAPLISHTNAMQAYRSSLNKFSLTHPGTPFKLWLYRYWALSLICGTVLVLVMTWKFFIYLPSWCQIDVEDDEMPPEPEETIVTRLLEKGEAGDEMKQNFVSAAVLQANESGALVRVLQDGKMKYVRSRRMPSMGFDPIMNVSELVSERDRLLQHVTYAANPSIDRGGMSSFDDTIRNSFKEPDRLRASSNRRQLNFMSFDASTMMRGDH